MFDGVKAAIAEILREEHHRFAAPDPSGVSVEVADKICRRVLKMKPDPAHQATAYALGKADTTIGEQAALIDSLKCDRQEQLELIKSLQREVDLARNMLASMAKDNAALQRELQAQLATKPQIDGPPSPPLNPPL